MSVASELRKTHHELQSTQTLNESIIQAMSCGDYCTCLHEEYRATILKELNMIDDGSVNTGIIAHVIYKLADELFGRIHRKTKDRLYQYLITDHPNVSAHGVRRHLIIDEIRCHHPVGPISVWDIYLSLLDPKSEYGVEIIQFILDQ